MDLEQRRIIMEQNNKYVTKDSGKRQEFSSGMVRDSEEKPLYTEVYIPLLKRYGELMQRGAKKYGRGNWRKACTEEELQRFKDSLLRHTMQYLNGESDEDHLAAVLFNAFGCSMVEDKLKEEDEILYSDCYWTEIQEKIQAHDALDKMENK
jgi:hypothetical protein